MELLCITTFASIKIASFMNRNIFSCTKRKILIYFQGTFLHRLYSKRENKQEKKKMIKSFFWHFYYDKRNLNFLIPISFRIINFLLYFFKIIFILSIIKLLFPTLFSLKFIFKSIMFEKVIWQFSNLQYSFVYNIQLYKFRLVQ